MLPTTYGRTSARSPLPATSAIKSFLSGAIVTGTKKGKFVKRKLLRKKYFNRKTEPNKDDSSLPPPAKLLKLAFTGNVNLKIPDRVKKENVYRKPI